MFNFETLAHTITMFFFDQDPVLTHYYPFPISILVETISSVRKTDYSAHLHCRASDFSAPNFIFSVSMNSVIVFLSRHFGFSTTYLFYLSNVPISLPRTPSHPLNNGNINAKVAGLIRSAFPRNQGLPLHAFSPTFAHFSDAGTGRRTEAP